MIFWKLLTLLVYCNIAQGSKFEDSDESLHLGWIKYGDNEYKSYAAKEEDHEEVKDMLRFNYGYRIYYKPATWLNAKRKCDKYKKIYNGKMVELRNEEIIEDLNHIMSHKYATVQHIWLGGIFKKNKKWYWISDNKKIKKRLIKQWLHNSTYVEDIEYMNTCLSMDIANFSNGAVYGTDCSFPQVFVCIFPEDKFEDMQMEEKRRAKKKRLQRKLKKQQ